MTGKFKAWLKQPHGWQLPLLWVFTALCIAGAVTFSVIGYEGWLPYLFYALAALSLGFTVYTLVKIFPTLKRKTVERLKNRKFTGKLIEEYGFRTVVFACASLLISLSNAAVNGIFGILYLSSWYGALAAYYLFLVTMRGGVLLYHRKKRKYAQNETEVQLKYREAKTHCICGIWLILLPLALTAVVIEIVAAERTFVRAGLMIYVSAAYTFYKITMSVYNFFKARKTDEMTVRAIRNVNLADALVSVFALQTAMFHEFSPEASLGYANMITGGIVCLLTASIGLFMIINGARAMRARRAEENTHNAA